MLVSLFLLLVLVVEAEDSFGFSFWVCFLVLVLWKSCGVFRFLVSSFLFGLVSLVFLVPA